MFYLVVPASDRRQNLIWSHKQLWGPHFSVCSPVATLSVPWCEHCCGGQWWGSGWKHAGAQMEGLFYRWKNLTCTYKQWRGPDAGVLSLSICTLPLRLVTEARLGAGRCTAGSAEVDCAGIGKHKNLSGDNCQDLRESCSSAAGWGLCHWWSLPCIHTCRAGLYKPQTLPLLHICFSSLFLSACLGGLNWSKTFGQGSGRLVAHPTLLCRWEEFLPAGKFLLGTQLAGIWRCRQKDVIFLLFLCGYSQGFSLLFHGVAKLS